MITSAVHDLPGERNSCPLLPAWPSFPRGACPRESENSISEAFRTSNHKRSARLRMRTRIQSFIYRRFYRSTYDAAKTLEEFSVKLREETDLGALSNDLVGV